MKKIYGSLVFLLVLALGIGFFASDVRAEEHGEDVHPALTDIFERFSPYTKVTDDILQRGEAGNTLDIFSTGWTNGVGLATHLTSHMITGTDRQISQFHTYSLVASNPDNTWNNNGIASFYYNGEGVVTLIQQHDVYWHDGTPLTLDDLVFAYELILHPDSTATAVVFSLPGFNVDLVDFVLSEDNRRLDIYFDRPLPHSIMLSGSIWTTPVPRHWIEPALEEVGHFDLEFHHRARHEAILGFGPFIIDAFFPGEEVSFIANDNYWRGAPLIDGIRFTIFPVDMLFVMADGWGDLSMPISPAAFPHFGELYRTDGLQLLPAVNPTANILYFGLGYRFLNEFGVYVNRLRTDNHPITNVAIRRALKYAIDFQTVSDVVMYGFSVPAPSILSPINAAHFINDELVGNSVFDLDKARQILDEAGFTQFDDEGFRLDLNGEHMYFVYAQHWNTMNDFFVPTNIANWAEIGLRVELLWGDFLEWSHFVDILFDRDRFAVVGEDIHIFSRGWSVNHHNPAPHHLWAVDSTNNLGRYTSTEFQQILRDINSVYAWDGEFLAEAYSRWQQYFEDNIPAINLHWPLDVVFANNRVVNFSRIRTDSSEHIPRNPLFDPGAWALVGLVAAE